MMTEPEFLREWHSNFPSLYQQHPPDKGRSKLAEIAREYHTQCDAFDDRICSGKHKGVSVPVTSLERAECVRNAKTVRTKQLAKAIDLGFSEKDFQEALVNNAT